MVIQLRAVNRLICWFLYVYSEQLPVQCVALGIIHVANGTRRLKNTYVSVLWKLVSIQNNFP